MHALGRSGALSGGNVSLGAKRPESVANTGLSSPYDVGAERYDVLHDGRDVQPYSDLWAREKNVSGRKSRRG